MEFIHGNTARSVDQTIQRRSQEARSKEENSDDELLDDFHTQLDRCVAIEDIECAVIHEVCKNTVEKANGKQRKRGKDGVEDALLAPWDVAGLGRGEEGKCHDGDVRDEEDYDSAFFKVFSGTVFRCVG